MESPRSIRTITPSPADRPLPMAVAQLAPVMSEVDRVLRETGALIAHEPDPHRRDALSGLIRDLEGRVAPISAEFARVCLRRLGPVRADGVTDLRDRYDPSDEAGLARLGLRFARSLGRFDPRVHGDQVALHEMREALLEEAPDRVGA